MVSKVGDSPWKRDYAGSSPVIRTISRFEQDVAQSLSLMSALRTTRPRLVQLQRDNIFQTISVRQMIVKFAAIDYLEPSVVAHFAR